MRVLCSQALGHTRERLDRARRRLLQGAALLALGADHRLLLAQQAAAAAASQPAAGNVAPPAAQPQPEAASQPAPQAPSQSRLALLLGNEAYPASFDLPPIPKNLRDLKAALAARGFIVFDALNLGLDGARQAVASFVAQAAKAPEDSIFFFYFSGHGAQVDATNLLLPAGLNPAADSDTLRDGSLQLLRDVVQHLPERRTGLVVAVVDACRTSLLSNRDNSGLNQVEAPPGCLITFSTGAGRPAIAPAVATQNTFYTASLVRLLRSESDQTSFADLFRLVRADVRKTMLNYPVAAIRELAQDPFIADHSFTRMTLGTQASSRATAFSSQDEAADWARLQNLSVPSQVVDAADAFLARYPDSKYASAARVARDGARTAAQLLRRNDIHLYVSDFRLPPGNETSEYRRDLLRAARGDKDAAARLGLAAEKNTSIGVDRAMARYEGWMQFAAALGNGIASYDLALYYRKQDQPQLAAQFEARARELGYTPPPTLDNVRR